MELLYTLTDYTYKYRADAPSPLPWGQTRHELTALRNETVACQLVFQPAETVLACLSQAPLLHWTPTPRLRIAVGEVAGPGAAVGTPVGTGAGTPVGTGAGAPVGTGAGAPVGTGAVHEPPLQSAEVSANFVGLVPVDLGNVLVADPLLPDESIEVRAGCRQAVWLSVRLPADAAPGRYTLPVALYRAEDFQDEVVAGRAELVLNVAPLSLPEPHEFTHDLDIWQHPTGLARGLGLRLWSEAHWQAIELYARELARLGQKAITIIASDSPWAGQRCRHDTGYPSTVHEYSIVGISRRPDGTLRFDFSRLDRYVETYLRLGIDREIEIIGLLAAWDDEFGRPLRDHPDNVRLACIDEASGRLTWLRTQEELRQYLRALQAHLSARGWWRITRFTADEPADVALFRQRIAFLHSVCPDAKAKIPCNHAEFMDEFLDVVADWVPNIYCLAGDRPATLRMQEAVLARGDRFSWYVCCHPARPNSFITSPSIEARFQGWFTAWTGLSGFLRWAFTCWPADAWRRPAWRFPHWPTGDMFFVYPGQDGRPVRSLRTETLLFGIQDHELIALARQRAAADPAVQQALDAAFARIIRAEMAAFADVDHQLPEALYSLDPADYEAARTAIIEALVASSGG